MPAGVVGAVVGIGTRKKRPAPFQLHGVTTKFELESDYVPKKKPEKARQKFTPLQRAIMGREE